MTTSEVHLRILGSGDAFGSGGRLPTCFYVDTDTTRFLLDCGPAVLPALKRYHLDPDAIDAILLTHLHGDHFGGVPFFLLDAHLIARRTRPLIIAGPPDTSRRVQAAFTAFFSSEPVWRFPIEYVTWTDGQAVSVGGLLVTPYQVVHDPAAQPHALRLELNGKVLAYSGDTEWTEALIAVAQAADLFICECSSFDRPIKGHLNYQAIMAHHDQLNYRRLMLTHMGDEVLQRLSELGVEAAEDGKDIIL